tara:strand:+ start:12009 stop:12188 length:180 start_codon:yes stop_codon:yes gene_type:complete
MKLKFDDKICIHAGKCIKNLPDVFKIVNDKFTIDEDAAEDSEIKKVVKLCPSGALTIDE